MSTYLTHSLTPEEEELEKKRAELSELEAELADRELELALLVGELRNFELRYLGAIGPLYARLDDLNAQIAETLAQMAPGSPEAHEAAAQARARAEESARTADDARGRVAAAPAGRSPELKKLYREVARAVHPDLANNEEERARRTRLMAKANDAFERGDEGALRAVLTEWESGPEAVTGDGTGAELVRVIRKIAQVRARLQAIEQEMAGLEQSPLCRLMRQAEEAQAQGRDLLAEMAAALQEQIGRAGEELQRLRGRKGGS